MSIPDQRDKEKRRFIRINIEADIICKIRGSDETFKGLCKNISYSGLNLITSKYLEERTELDITVNVDSGVFQPLKAILIVKKVKRRAGGKYIVTGEMKEVK